MRDAFLCFSPVSEHLFYVGQFLMGRMKVPVSRFRLQDRAELPLVERSLTALTWAPDRRVGFAYDLDLAHHQLPVRLRAGAFDGLAEGAGNGPLLAARIDLTPSDWTGGPLRVELGAAWFLDRNRQPDPEQARQEQEGVVLDTRLAWGPLWLEGETFWIDAQTGSGFERFGWSLTAGWALLADFLEATVRYEQLSGPTATPEADTRQITGGFSLYYLADRFWMRYNAVWLEQAGLADELQHWILFQLRI